MPQITIASRAMLDWDAGAGGAQPSGRPTTASSTGGSNGVSDASPRAPKSERSIGTGATSPTVIAAGILPPACKERPLKKPAAIAISATPSTALQNQFPKCF